MIRYYFIILSTLMFGCANQTSPTGGPTDKKAPILVESNPTSNQRNFKGKTIELTFDESVQLNNPNEEILISPPTGKKTKFSAKGRKILIIPELELTENTTYSINFREGIKDITEGNITDSLSLAFSTGPVIDSLEISGQVAELLTGKEMEKITVGVYESDTFDIFEDTPINFTFSDKKGHFTLRNLKTKPYWVYAFEDKNKNLKVESKSEKFGFLSNITKPNDTSALKLGMIKMDTRQIKITSVRNTDKLASIRINKEVNSIKVKNPYSSHVYTFGNKKDEFLIHHTIAEESDSALVELSFQDSLQAKLDTTIYIKGSNQKYVDEQFRISNIKLTNHPKTKKQEIQFRTNKLIKKINYDSIFIQYDSTHRVNLSAKDTQYDTLENLLTFKLTLIDSLLKKESSLIFAPTSFISYKNDTTKKSTYPIKIPKPEETSTIEIHIDTQKPNYVIQLIKEDGTLVQEVSNVKEHKFEYLDPLTYKLRIIIDRNGNRKWDPGNFFTRDEPEEIIYYINSEKQSTIPTRANWEVGPLSIKF